MSVLKIPCPKCHTELKLRDPKMLGRKGKCPKCRYAFRLQLPELQESADEVQFELASQTPAQVAVGTAARWVPDDAQVAQRSSVPPVGSPAASAGQAVSPVAQDPSGLPDFSTAAAPSSGVGRLQEIRRKNRKRRNITILTSGVVATLLFGSYYGYKEWKKGQPAPDDGKPGVNVAYQAEKESLEKTSELSRLVSPTSGQPIALPYIPAGSRVVVHLRPSELWSQRSQAEELRACLGPVGSWLEQEIQQVCLFEPAAIEEATFCLILGGRGVPPQMSALVRMHEPLKKSEWLEKAQAVRNDEYGMPVYLTETRAYLLNDDMKTFAVGPVDVVDEMVAGARFPNPTATEIEEILKSTDSDQMVTFVFEPSQLRMNMDQLLSENVQDIANLLLDWFGDDVEAVAWSLHVGQDFFSKLVLLPSKVSNPVRLQQTVRKDLDAMPTEMLGAIRKMEPKQRGPRRIIGRFPAMMQAVRMGTKASIDGRFVELTTVLPERAAPNLVMGTLLAWDESTRTDFSAAAVAATGNGSNAGQASIAERLKTPIELDFRRTPLQEAIDYIAFESKIPFEIDGDALKLSGYTKNMPQTFNLGKKPAIDGLREILKQYDKMCIVIDEAANKATVMTFPVAEQKKLKPSLP